MHPDLNAQAADLYRAEMERAALRERRAAQARNRPRSLWTRIRTPRRSQTLAA